MNKNELMYCSSELHLLRGEKKTLKYVKKTWHYFEMPALNTSQFWMEDRIAWCTSPGPVSNTASELLKPERPSAPTRTLYDVPGINPFKRKKLREPLTFSFFNSSLPIKFLGTQHLYSFIHGEISCHFQILIFKIFFLKTEHWENYILSIILFFMLCCSKLPWRRQLHGIIILKHLLCIIINNISIYFVILCINYAY